MIDKDEVMKALAGVEDPELGRSLTELDMIKDIAIDGGAVKVTVALTIAGCPLKHKIATDIKAAVGEVAGVDKVAVEMTAMTKDQKTALSAKLQGAKPDLSLSAETVVIGVASGKGGVGKSTVTINLAAAVAGLGYKVGLLDADIWGSSIPRMLGLRWRPSAVGNMIIPLTKYGMKIMSIGFFSDEEQPIIWRGPLVHRAIEQFLTQVFWEDLDFLFIDLPPGTGDVTISLAKLVPNLKMLMVTTPQPAAEKVAVRAGHMAHKSDIEVIGVIENMSYLACADCGSKNYLFGRGGGLELAKSLGVPLLGELPFDPVAREGGDTGEPVVISHPDSAVAKEIFKVAKALASLSLPSLAH